MQDLRNATLVAPTCPAPSYPSAPSTATHAIIFEYTKSLRPPRTSQMASSLRRQFLHSQLICRRR
jgi:hypothetical protein